MKSKLVRSTWLEEQGRRLDCHPYLSDAMESTSILSRLSAKKTPLRELTREGMAGIFNDPRFARSVGVNDRMYVMRNMAYRSSTAPTSCAQT